MTYLIVGHRGVGKTTFVQRVKYYYGARALPCQAFDLDEEIEKREDRTIAEIFQSHGEAYFRDLEKDVLASLIRQAATTTDAVFIAVGAGYTGEIPAQVKVWWLRRPSDRAGRIFVDRPRLENEITPLAEFMNRFDAREERFRKINDREIMLAEGWDFINQTEPTLIGLKPADLEASVTVLPEHMATATRFEEFIRDYLMVGVRYFELRDDLLTEDEMRKVIREVPHDKVLISFRKKETSPSLIQLSGAYATDWALELGPSPLQHNSILSLHTRELGESVDEAAERLLAHKADHYKFAVPILNFVELWAGHRFLVSDSLKRSFLPVSPNGRWHWYRLLQKKKMRINFVRSGDGSSLDQPLLFDYIRYPETARGFAAILGDPVSHSRTPAEQSEFFLPLGLGVVAIQMQDHECDSLSLSIIERMGLKAAAVTSPLKNKIRGLCAHVDKKGEELSSVNTIVLTSAGWSGTNTDIDGLQSVFSAFEIPGEVAVWGGGGTRLVLKTLLPFAHFFSARRGQEIWVENPTPVSPDVVVWALGRSRVEATKTPPTDWQPKYVVDLNYTQDSPGLEYAMNTGAKYISGKGLFKSQAKGQRDFWSQSQF